MEQARQSQPDALAARIYLGNIPYAAKPHEIERLLAANGFNEVEKIHISIDPVSGRNPGYCFVDFRDRDTADHALASLSATICGRSIKVGHCEPKKQHDRGEVDYAFKRWGDWGTEYSDDEMTNDQPNDNEAEHGPNAALYHFEDMEQSCKGRRLFVGGLGKMINQPQHNRDIMELFSQFTPVAVGKRISTYGRWKSVPGNHHYCFVDFETTGQAIAAMHALNGKIIPDGRLKVSLVDVVPNNLMKKPSADVRDKWRAYDGGVQLMDSRSRNTAPSNRATASTNWRKRDTGEP